VLILNNCLIKHEYIIVITSYIITLRLHYNAVRYNAAPL